MNSAKFHEDVSEMIIVKDIEIYSHVRTPYASLFWQGAYCIYPQWLDHRPKQDCKSGRCICRRLQVQERLTTQILDAIKETLNPLGVAVVIEASHLCMMMRGVQKQNSVTTTSAFWGEFEKNETRSEFIKLISADFH